MLNFFKNKKQKAVELDDEAVKKSAEKSAAFFKADSEARKAAGLERLPGEYTFTCPNCGSECKGSWHAVHGEDSLHGRTDCFTCNIHLMV